MINSWLIYCTCLGVRDFYYDRCCGCFSFFLFVYLALQPRGRVRSSTFDWLEIFLPICNVRFPRLMCISRTFSILESLHALDFS